MTDDEINKKISTVTAILPDSRDRTIYLAGMSEAASIVRTEFSGDDAAIGALVALVIERAAGGEG